jgi:hypothetical protein
MLKRSCILEEWSLSLEQSAQDGSTTRTPNTSREYTNVHDVGTKLTVLVQLSDRAWMVCYRLKHRHWTISDHLEGMHGCPT